MAGTSQAAARVVELARLGRGVLTDWKVIPGRHAPDRHTRLSPNNRAVAFQRKVSRRSRAAAGGHHDALGNSLDRSARPDNAETLLPALFGEPSSRSRRDAGVQAACLSVDRGTFWNFRRPGRHLQRHHVRQAPLQRRDRLGPLVALAAAGARPAAAHHLMPAKSRCRARALWRAGDPSHRCSSIPGRRRRMACRVRRSSGPPAL